MSGLPRVILLFRHFINLFPPILLSLARGTGQFTALSPESSDDYQRHTMYPHGDECVVTCGFRLKGFPHDHGNQFLILVRIA